MPAPLLRGGHRENNLRPRRCDGRHRSHGCDGCDRYNRSYRSDRPRRCDRRNRGCRNDRPYGCDRCNGNNGHTGLERLFGAVRSGDRRRRGDF